MTDKSCKQELLLDDHVFFLCLRDKGHSGSHEWHNDPPYLNEIKIQWSERKKEEG